MFKPSSDPFGFADPARNSGHGERKAPQLHKLDLPVAATHALAASREHWTKPAAGHIRCRPPGAFLILRLKSGDGAASG